MTPTETLTFVVRYGRLPMTGVQKRVLRSLFRNGATCGSDIARECGISGDDCAAACMWLLSQGLIVVHGCGVMATGSTPPADELDD